MQRTTTITMTEEELNKLLRTAVAQGIEAYERGKHGSQVLTTTEAARLKGVHPQTIRNAIASGELKAFPKNKRHYGIKLSDLEKYMPRTG